MQWKDVRIAIYSVECDECGEQKLFKWFFYYHQWRHIFLLSPMKTYLMCKICGKCSEKM